MKLHNILFVTFLIAAVMGAGKSIAGQHDKDGHQPERRADFDANWHFHLGDVPEAKEPSFDDASWRLLNLPHDWSIEGAFNKDNPAGVGGGALPGGIGWYRKEFTVPESDKGKLLFIDFEGVYMDSKVWINGHYLGVRPYGYSSFQYELTPYLNYGSKPNVISVRVDNLKQPNSRWYSGSGIYRNVYLVTTNKIHVAHWGSYITTPEVNERRATIDIQTTINNADASTKEVTLKTIIYNDKGKVVTEKSISGNIDNGDSKTFSQALSVEHPDLWSTDNPVLYKAISIVKNNGKEVDRYETSFGIRYFRFDSKDGFFLNGRHLKIKGMCYHQDWGCLGAAVYTRALQRQLEMYKSMGVNAIRTSHNPPSPEMLQLCDKMGILVMDEAFDCWKKGKNPYDYHLYWDQWHKKDLSDMICRDRNHPSVVIWSIGNEIPDQWDSAGAPIARELRGIVRSLDTTRPITSAMNDPEAKNNELSHSGAMDLIGHNYRVDTWKDFFKYFPDGKFIATETTSALETRGEYDMPSDSIFIWPREGVPMNANFTCSAYDNCRVPWGATHEKVLKAFMKDNFVSGMFVWTGFDYLGEPTPYRWPARSSYFGIIDLAGFPKDAYYLYKSVWTNTPVLHIFPYWNWKTGYTVDVWAYYNDADRVELFLNGKSLGSRSKEDGNLHVMWRVPYQPGILKAISYKNGKVVLTREIHTAGPATKMIIEPDRKHIHADGKDLSFVTVKIVDANGTLIPHADNLIHFKISGEGFIAGMDNGNEIDHESFKGDQHKAFNGLCLAVIQSDGKKGEITLTATSEGLPAVTTVIEAGE
ncbi:MAG: beta-galactosidase GalB [Chitinophagaceae bacterium]